MQIEITKRFGKQVIQCQDRNIRVKLSIIINDILKANNLSEIRNIKKLKGAKDFYRIRIGNYRVGLAFQDGQVILAAFDHRSDIYKYFP
jgi:mRNA interferase RelE/StbE